MLACSPLHIVKLSVIIFEVGGGLMVSLISSTTTSVQLPSDCAVSLKVIVPCSLIPGI